MRCFFLPVFLFLLTCSIASAGNVNARVSGGQLFVYGDAGDNSITIRSAQMGEIQVIGAPGFNGESTSVNGQVNGTVILTGWNGGIFCYTYGGTDSVSLPYATVLGTTHFDLGDGDDDLNIGLLPLPPLVEPVPAPPMINGFVDLRSSLYVIGANGDDYVSMVNAKVRYGVTFDLGDGADSLLVGDGSFAGSMVELQSYCNVYPGNGVDSSNFAATLIRGTFFFDDYTSNGDLSLQGVTIQQNAILFGTSSKDSIVLEHVSVSRLLQIFTEFDDDTVKLLSTQCETLEIFAGSGADRVQLDSVTCNTLRVFLDAGADTLSVTLGKFQKLYWYGGSDNDTFNVSTTTANELNLFGDGGTDTLLRAGNTIGTTRLYSVENQ